MKFNWEYRFLMDQAGDGAGGGGAGSGDSGQKKEPSIAEIIEQNKSLQARLDALEGKNKDKDKSINEKVEDHNKDKERRDSDSKELESAVRFDLQSNEFLKNNASLLPKKVSDIFTVASKEKYDSPVEKAREIKAGIVEEFFKVQSNMDLLTPYQKGVVEDYLKLTKLGRIKDAQQIYQTIFEPTLEMLRGIKKAEQVNHTRNGFGDGSDEPYKQRLIEGSKQHYLGEKKNGT